MDSGHAPRVRGIDVTLICLSAALLAQSPATDSSARDRLHQYIDGLARTDLAARANTMAGLRTKQDAERRRAATRDTLRRLVGDLPAHSGRVAVKEFGSVMADGFQVDT